MLSCSWLQFASLSISLSLSQERGNCIHQVRSGASHWIGVECASFSAARSPEPDVGCLHKTRICSKAGEGESAELHKSMYCSILTQLVKENCRCSRSVQVERISVRVQQMALTTRLLPADYSCSYHCDCEGVKRANERPAKLGHYSTRHAKIDSSWK